MNEGSKTPSTDKPFESLVRIPPSRSPILRNTQQKKNCKSNSYEKLFGSRQPRGMALLAWRLTRVDDPIQYRNTRYSVYDSGKGGKAATGINATTSIRNLRVVRLMSAIA